MNSQRRKLIFSVWLGLCLGVAAGFGVCAWLVEQGRYSPLGLRMILETIIMPIAFFLAALPWAIVGIAAGVRRYRNGLKKAS
jgi:hypothetical protein